MREIKFKAKRVSDSEWVEGSFIYPNEIIPHQHTCDEMSIGVPIVIYPSTISQFTGLTDKNGKEVYEGDVIRCKMFYMDSFLPHQGTIVYNTDHCTYATKNESGLTFMMHHDIGSIEIIGNIHNK